MLDHMGFPVADDARSKHFYEKALAPLGYRPIMEVEAKDNPRARPAKVDTGFASGRALRAKVGHVFFA